MRKPSKTVKAAAVKRQILASIPDLTLDDMRRFHSILNWAELWEDWYLSLNESGRPKYATVLRFAKHLAKNKKQFDFLMYYLGPPLEQVQIDQISNEFTFVTPQDWYGKRETGGWSSDATVRAMHRTITSRMNGLDAIREVGNTITLPSVTRAEKLAELVDKHFNFGRFPEDIPYKELISRLKDYLGLHHQCVQLKQRAIDLYAKCHGIDFSQENGLTTFLQVSLANSQSDSNSATNRVHNVLSQLTEMTLTKAARYKTPLPPGAEQIIEAAAEAIEKPKKVH